MESHPGMQYNQSSEYSSKYLELPRRGAVFEMLFDN